ncbi:hypothetical protein [uncultured Rothia sp.]|uniref:hypothetical protein n=1 Tax=uncultured Rothia sp. TaxID=316088 RepID=UPI002624F3F9|nr:hypothetical protein [uncultured Rothia sp.]
MLEVVIALSLAVLVGSAIAHKTRIIPENVLKVLETHEKEKELRLGVIEAQRDILKRLRDEGRIDTNVVRQIQERLDIEVLRVLGPLELE